MRQKFFSFSIIAFLIFQSGIIFAQDIDSLITEALKNNPQLKSLEFQITSAEYRAQSVRSLPPPTLGLEFSQVPINEFNVWNKALSNSVSLSQMFHLGGKLKAMANVEQKNALIAKDDSEIYRLNLIAQLKMSYYNLWLIEKKIEIQQKNIDLLKNLGSAINIGYQINRINQADLLTVKSEIAANDAQLLILRSQKEAEVYRLNKLLGRNLESKEVYTMSDISNDSLSISQAQLEEKLEQSNPELQKMNSMVAMNRAMLRSNNKELIPDLMLQAMIMRMPQGMILTSKSDLSMLEGKTETMYGVMASISLPFIPWSAKKYKAQKQEYLAQLKNIEYGKNDMQREMNALLKEALVKLKTAKDLEKLYVDQVLPLSRKAVAAQVSAYQNSQANITTVIDNYKMLLMQEMNYYMAQADFQMAKAEIEMMVGGIR
ncbi:MAG TPA: TolC family protein [bacterium]